MANPIDEKMRIGTIGELLVQLRLLQYGIQAAPPIKDSGNDLVALKGRQIRLIQVKTTANNVFPKLPGKRKIYDLLAIVRLKGYDQTLTLDDSNIFLIPKNSPLTGQRKFDLLDDYELEKVVDGYFSRSWSLRADAAAGKFDQLVDEAEAERRAGTLREFPKPYKA